MRVNGVPRGQTGDRIHLQTGHHIFDLGKPRDYTPPNVQTPVAGTTEANPMVIGFLPAPIAFGGGAALAPLAAKKKGAAKKKKGAAKKKKKAAAKTKKSGAKRGRRKVR